MGRTSKDKRDIYYRKVTSTKKASNRKMLSSLELYEAQRDLVHCTCYSLGQHEDSALCVRA
jgi:hypothetical protein